MASFSFAVPKIDITSMNQQKYTKKIYDQLIQMNETLRYMFDNLDGDNFSSAYNQQIASYGEGINSLVKDVEGNYSLITQTATEIRAEVGSLQTDLNGKITQNTSLISQTATEIRSEVNSIQISLQGQINANTSSITQTATEIRSEVTSKFMNYSTTEQMNSAISQTASSITSTVSQQINGVTTQISQVEQTANKINWLVASGTSSSNFTLTSRVASLVASAINITGYVTFNNLSSSGQTTINGSNITTGTIDATKVNVTNVVAKSVSSDWVYAGNISASQIRAGTIDASIITVTNLDVNNIRYGTWPVISVTGSSTSPTISIGKPSGWSSTAGQLDLVAANVNIGASSGGNSTVMFYARSSQKLSVSTISTASAASIIAAKLNDVILLLRGYGLCTS